MTFVQLFYNLQLATLLDYCPVITVIIYLTFFNLPRPTAATATTA